MSRLRRETAVSAHYRAFAEISRCRKVEPEPRLRKEWRPDHSICLRRARAHRTLTR